MSNRRSLWRRVFAVVAAVLALELVLFAAVVRATRADLLAGHYATTLALLDVHGALDTCDAEPAAFRLGVPGRGEVYPLYPEGTAFHDELLATHFPPASELAAGEIRRAGSPWIAWPALARIEREGTCQYFYLTPPEARDASQAPLLKILAQRAFLASMIMAAILCFIVRPLVTRIQRLARNTGALAARGFDGQVPVEADELGDIAEVVNKAAAHARAMVDAEARHREMLHELFADLSHDVRTPLASIKLSTDALRHGDGPENITPSLRAEVEYLDAMFANLATIARLRSEILPIEKRETDLRDVLLRIGDRFRPLGDDRGVSVAVAVPESSVLALADPLTLEQAFGNAVHNAIKFADANVAVVLERGTDQALVRVLDDGPGFPAKLKSQLTERRVRTLDGRGGHGLGLAIAEQIIERHQGTLEFGEHEGATCVLFRVPLHGGL